MSYGKRANELKAGPVSGFRDLASHRLPSDEKIESAFAPVRPQARGMMRVYAFVHTLGLQPL
jgi:hypothetical protein